MSGVNGAVPKADTNMARDPWQSGRARRVGRLLNYEFNARLRKRLRDNKRAVQYLTHRGFTLETIDAFGLGLSAPYHSKKAGGEVADALVYPLRDWEGKFYNKYGYYNVPGVTLNPPETVGWISGEPRTYYGQSAVGKKWVFVCQRAIDLWRLWQAVEATKIAADLLLICSTHETAFPTEWREPRFWAKWETVYLGFDNDQPGEALSSSLSELASKDVCRVLAPSTYGKDWTEFWQGGAEAEEFVALLRDAPVFSLRVQGDTEAEQGYGRFAYKPVNINGAFHKGHLYGCVANID